MRIWHASQSVQQVHCNSCSIFQKDLNSEFLTSSHPRSPGGDNYERYASWYATGYPNELEHYSVKAANWNETWKKQRRNEYVCAMATQLVISGAQGIDCRIPWWLQVLGRYTWYWYRGIENDSDAQEHQNAWGVCELHRECGTTHQGHSQGNTKMTWEMWEVKSWKSMTRNVCWGGV